MKKIIITAAAIVFVLGSLSAQSTKDYRLRNHKLNKNYKSVSGEKIAVAKSDIETDVFGYLKRNAKFHKTTNENALVIAKDKINYNYRALNRKLNKQHRNKLNNDAKSDDVLSKK